MIQLVWEQEQRNTPRRGKHTLTGTHRHGYDLQCLSQYEGEGWNGSQSLRMVYSRAATTKYRCSDVKSPWAPRQRVWSLEASFSDLQMAVFLLGSYTICPLFVYVPSVSPCVCKCPLLTRRGKWQLIPGKSQGERPGGPLSIRSQSWTPRSYGTHTTRKDTS